MLNKQDGFTFVESAIVLLIVGILIGGIFGGMAVIENQKISSTITNIKKVDSAVNIFKTNFGTLPGDLIDPSILKNCTTAPCNRVGDGNGIVGVNGTFVATEWFASITADTENLAFWQQLYAEGLLTEGLMQSASLEYGEGQFMLPIESGMRITFWRGAGWAFYFYPTPRHIFIISRNVSDVMNGGTALDYSTDVKYIAPMDRKMDDGMPLTGRMGVNGCISGGWSATSPYSTTGNCWAWYIYNF